MTVYEIRSSNGWLAAGATTASAAAGYGFDIVKLTDCRLFPAFRHEAKPLKLPRAAIGNLPRFRSESG